MPAGDVIWMTRSPTKVCVIWPTVTSTSAIRPGVPINMTDDAPVADPSGIALGTSELAAATAEPGDPVVTLTGTAPAGPDAVVTAMLSVPSLPHGAP